MKTFQLDHRKRLALCAEMDAIIDLSAKAQACVSNDQMFFRQVALLFHRVNNMSALKDEVMLCSLEEIEEAARQSCCGDCD